MTRSCELHVTWLHAADADAALLAEATSWLDVAEHDRAGRFARREDATDFLLGRWLARRALAATTGTRPDEWSFDLGDHGKPLARGPSVHAPAFNLSHGGGLVVCALCATADSSVGVDVESISRRLPGRRLERFLTERELHALGPESGSAFARRFWRTWTLKEATLKAAGTDLRSYRSGMKKYPQTMINVTVNGRVELGDYPEVATAVERVESVLGERGRVLLRPSGTEPKIRVMVEGEDHAEVQQLCSELAADVERLLG